MKRYTYINKRTGKKVYSDKPINDPRLVLVTKLADTQMKKSQVQTR